MSDLIAPKGSLVCCPKGHVLCELSHDLHIGDVNWSMKFVNWRGQQAPAAGTLEIKCPTCKTIVHDMNNGPQYFFRPPKEVRRMPF